MLRHIRIPRKQTFISRPRGLLPQCRFPRGCTVKREVLGDLLSCNNPKRSDPPMPTHGFDGSQALPGLIARVRRFSLRVAFGWFSDRFRGCRSIATNSRVSTVAPPPFTPGSLSCDTPYPTSTIEYPFRRWERPWVNPSRATVHVVAQIQHLPSLLLD